MIMPLLYFFNLIFYIQDKEIGIFIGIYLQFFFLETFFFAKICFAKISLNLFKTATYY